MHPFDLFSGKPKRFVSQESFAINLASQLTMAPQTLTQLRQLGVTPDRALKLDRPLPPQLHF
jgi:hypothetical protein